MSWEDVDRGIELNALAWKEATGRLVRAALREIDDILDPVRAEKRKIIRAELMARARIQAEVNRLAVKLRERER